MKIIEQVNFIISVTKLENANVNISLRNQKTLQGFGKEFNDHEECRKWILEYLETELLKFGLV